MLKVIYQDKEYAEKVELTAKISLPFWVRVTFLFRNKMSIRHNIYVEYEMVPFKSELKISIYSYWDQLKDFMKKRRKPVTTPEMQKKIHDEIQPFVLAYQKQGFTPRQIKRIIKNKYQVIIK